MATPSTAQGKTTTGDWKDSFDEALHDAAHKHGKGKARIAKMELDIDNPHVKGYRITLQS